MNDVTNGECLIHKKVDCVTGFLCGTILLPKGPFGEKTEMFVISSSEIRKFEKELIPSLKNASGAVTRARPDRKRSENSSEN